MLVGCGQRALTPPAPPLARAPIVVDGEWHEDDWNARALRAIFAARGAEARPYSEVRLLRDGDRLAVGLYAADEDLRARDTFTVAIGGAHLAVDASGAVTGVPGAQAQVDRDGTLDDPRDDDEEWVVELTVPLDALPRGAAVPVRASRCDVTKDGVRRCGAWSGAIDLSGGAR